MLFATGNDQPLADGQQSLNVVLNKTIVRMINGTLTEKIQNAEMETRASSIDSMRTKNAKINKSIVETSDLELATTSFCKA